MEEKVMFDRDCNRLDDCKAQERIKELEDQLRTENEQRLQHQYHLLKNLKDRYKRSLTDKDYQLQTLQQDKVNLELQLKEIHQSTRQAEFSKLREMASLKEEN